MGLSLHLPAEQLPHNKVEKLVVALNQATCSSVDTDIKIFSILVISNKQLQHQNQCNY